MHNMELVHAVFVTWNIWLTQNRLCWEGKPIDFGMIAHSAEAQVNVWFMAFEPDRTDHEDDIGRLNTESPCLTEHIA